MRRYFARMAKLEAYTIIKLDYFATADVPHWAALHISSGHHAILRGSEIDRPKAITFLWL